MIIYLWGNKTVFMKKEDSINKTEHQNVKTVEVRTSLKCHLLFEKSRNFYCTFTDEIKRNPEKKTVSLFRHLKTNSLKNTGRISF